MGSLLANADNLAAARSLMALSLGFHIVLASLGVALPTLIFVVHRRGLAGDADALALAKRWSKVAGVLFAVGAVSGTVLSFEMGLLWPGLMGTFGGVIGLPFALEGIFFFLEAIFLGIYLYGWRGLPARLHLATLVPVAISGVAGTLCVLAVNSWMNHPSGFDRAHYLATGEVTEVRPWAAMFNPALPTQALHMVLAAYLVTAGLVGSVYACGWLRGRRDHLHRLGVTIPVVFLAIAAPVQLVSGDLAVRYVARAQPAKLASMELLERSGPNAPYTIGGYLVDGEVRGAIDVPGGLSLALHGNTDAPVTGLDAIPPAVRPPVNVVRTSFQMMVAVGTGLLGLAAWVGWAWWRRRRLPEGRWFLRAVVAAGPATVVALEAGWTTTEVGRQPWIAREVMLVSAAVTPRGGIGWALAAIVAVYLGLGASTVVTLRAMSRRWRAGADVVAPYEPAEDRGGGDGPSTRPTAVTAPASDGGRAAGPEAGA
jgi:cytochrome d ubiquinol oxidase subunit I